MLGSLTDLIATSSRLPRGNAHPTLGIGYLKTADDTVWDVQVAGKAGVLCVGVLSGGIGAAELTEAGAGGMSLVFADSIWHRLSPSGSATAGGAQSAVVRD